MRGKHASQRDLAYCAIALALIVLMCALLAYMFFSGPFLLFDDSIYMHYAHAMLTGAYKPITDVFSFEFLTIAILAAYLKLIGPGIAAVVAPSLVAYIIMSVLIFASGRRLYGTAFGLVASFLGATAPFVVGYATRTLPDMGIGMITAAAVYLLVLSNGRRHAAALAALSGFFAGLAALVKTQGLLIAASFVLAATAMRVLPGMLQGKRAKDDRREALLGMYGIAGALIGVCLMLLLFAAYTGNPFFSIENYGSAAAMTSFPTLSQEIQRVLVILNPYTYYSKFVPMYQSKGLGFAVSSQPVYPVGLLLDMSIIGSIIAVADMKGRSRDRPLGMLAAFNLVALLYMFLGSESIRSYQPVQLSPRLLSFVLPSIALTAAYLLFRACAWMRKRTMPELAYACCGVVLVATVALNVPLYGLFYNTNHTIHNMTSAYIDALSYAETASAHRQVTLYARLAQDDLQVNALRALSSAYKNLSIVTAYNAAYACASGAGQGDAFILIGNFPSAVGQDLGALGAACATTPISSTTGPFDIFLYRVDGRK